MHQGEDMSDQQPYPRQPHEGVPEESGSRRGMKAVLVAVGVLAALGAMVTVGYGVLWALNPMGDEWICSDGETPAGKPGNYNQCFVDGSTLPRGYEWDPWGNRPMSYNCDKSGWVHIERIPKGGVPADVEEDCVKEGTELPGRWHLVDED